VQLRKNLKPVEKSPHSKPQDPKTAAAVVEAAAEAEGVDYKDKEAVEAVEVDLPVQVETVAVVEVEEEDSITKEEVEVNKATDNREVMEATAEVEVAEEISVEAAEAAAAEAVASVKVQVVPWAVAAEVTLTGPWTDFSPSKASPLSTSPLLI